MTSARFFAALALASAIACGSRSEPSPPPAAPAKATTATAASTEAHADAGAVKLCEHRVPAELCTRCNPDLVPVFQAQGDWCEEHGVPESQCLKCNPNLTFTATAAPQDWCKEHGVPESKCTKRNPRLVAQFVEAGDYCREHGYPESVCPICHPELPEAAGQKAPVFPEPGTKVRLASAETVADAGIQTQRAERRRFGRTLDVVGQLEFNQNRLAQLSARHDAVVVEVKVDVGDEVKAGAPPRARLVVRRRRSGAPSRGARALATAESALSRERQLAERGISPRKAVEDAERDLAEARAELDTARSALTAAGSAPGESGGRHVLRAPFAGTVVARHAVAGKTATAGEELVQVADLSTMWAQLEIPRQTRRQSGRRFASSSRGCAARPATRASPGSPRASIRNRARSRLASSCRTLIAR